MMLIKQRLNPSRLSSYVLLAFWGGLTFSSAMAEVTFVAAFLLWIILKVRSGSFSNDSIPRSVFYPLVGFVALAVGSYFWSEFQVLSYRGVFKVLQQVMVFWLVADIFQGQGDLKRFQYCFLGIAVLVVLNGHYQYFTGHDFIRGFQAADSSAGLRINASFKTYGQLASFMLCTIPFLATLVIFYRKHEKNLWLFAASLLALIGSCSLLFLTRSRGAFLAFFVGFFAWLILKKKFWFMGLLIVAVSLGVLILPHSMVIHLDAEGKEQSLVERYFLWDRAVQVIAAKPWGGTGINTYSISHLKYDKTKSWRVRHYYAHNGYLQLAAETGIPCLLFFLGFLGIHAFRSLRFIQSRPHAPSSLLSSGLFLGICNFLAFAMVDTVLHNPMAVMTLWYLLGMQLAYQRAYREASST